MSTFSLLTSVLVILVLCSIAQVYSDDGGPKVPGDKPLNLEDFIGPDGPNGGPVNLVLYLVKLKLMKIARIQKTNKTRKKRRLMQL
uniref:Uncharacterized protein n=1 Tax=Ditylenchus dipsaci TaxID=166011 RepID=A0A915EC20_9BILA